MQLNFFKCLVIINQPQDSFMQNFYVQASDCGSAIDHVLSCVREMDLPDPWICNFDEIEKEDFLAPEIKYDEARKIYFETVHHSFPYDETYFKYPYGIVESYHNSVAAPSLQQGFIISQQDQLLIITINVAHDKLLATYSGLLHEHKNFLGIMYKIHRNWDDAKEDALFMSDAYNTAKKITEHIENNKIDSLENGFVSLVSFVEEDDTNLNITNFKTIQLVTYSQKILNKVHKKLLQLGFLYLEKDVTIEDFNRWHYKHAAAKNKRQLISYLQRLDFHKV